MERREYWRNEVNACLQELKVVAETMSFVCIANNKNIIINIIIIIIIYIIIIIIIYIIIIIIIIHIIITSKFII